MRRLELEVSQDQWVQKLFADDTDFDIFLDALEDYDSDTFPVMTPVVFQPTYEIGFSLGEHQRFQARWGGFNAVTKEVTPLRFSDDVDLQLFLNSLAGAIENGLVSRSKWTQQLFADDDELDAFLEALELFDERLSDRQFRMIYVLGGNAWSCTTNADAACAVRAAADRLRQAQASSDTSQSDRLPAFIDGKLSSH